MAYEEGVERMKPHIAKKDGLWWVYKDRISQRPIAATKTIANLKRMRPFNGMTRGRGLFKSSIKGETL